MNSPQVLTHTVAPTPEGKFAIISPSGETIYVVACEALAIQWAASLDAEPVRSPFPVGRWTPEERVA